MNLNPAAIRAAVTAARHPETPPEGSKALLGAVTGVLGPTTLWRVATYNRNHNGVVAADTTTDYDDEPAAIRAETRAHREGKQAFRYPVEVQP